MSPPPIPIDLALAHQQHAAYCSLMEKLIPHVVKIPGDPAHPDCCFIEDTAIVLSEFQLAVIPQLGHPTRQGEQWPVKAELVKLFGSDRVKQLESPATLDGGDVLWTGKHLFVGLSNRTNAESIRQLRAIVPSSVPVYELPVAAGLHLKSICSHVTSNIIVMHGSEQGRNLAAEIGRLVPSHYRFVYVPDVTAANVLPLGQTMVIQAGFPSSEPILRQLADELQLSVATLTMSEFIKADGALTCCSILFSK